MTRLGLPATRRATHATPRFAHARTTAWTSSAVAGSTAAAGITWYWSSPSDSYVNSSPFRARTRFGPTMLESRSITLRSGTLGE